MRINRTPGVASTRTAIALSTKWENRPQPGRSPRSASAAGHGTARPVRRRGARRGRPRRSPLVEADANRSADTHLLPFPLPRRGASTSTSRTSRRTPPARSSTGWPARCSSTRSATAGSARAPRSSRRRPGSTAVSEAYFARMLGLPFIAVMPASHLAGEDRR